MTHSYICLCILEIYSLYLNLLPSNKDKTKIIATGASTLPGKYLTPPK